MPGVEIISKTEIMDPPDWAVPVVLISLFGLVITFALSKIFEGFNKKAESISIISFGVCFVALIVSVWGMGQKTKPTGLYQYEAYIEEGVDLLNFHEKYELISIEDNVFVFKDKVAESGEIEWFPVLK